MSLHLFENTLAEDIHPLYNDTLPSQALRQCADFARRATWIWVKNCAFVFKCREWKHDFEKNFLLQNSLTSCASWGTSDLKLCQRLRF